MTTRHGLWQAIGIEREQTIEWRYDSGNKPAYPEAARQVHRSGGLVSVNYPCASCSRCDWVFDDWDHNDAIEVWNGATEPPLNELAINKWHVLLVSGQRVTAIGGSDSHHPLSLNGLPTTVVKARSLSQADVLFGVKQALVYIVERLAWILNSRSALATGPTRWVKRYRGKKTRELQFNSRPRDWMATERASSPMMDISAIR